MEWKPLRELENENHILIYSYEMGWDVALCSKTKFTVKNSGKMYPKNQSPYTHFISLDKPIIKA